MLRKLVRGVGDAIFDSLVRTVIAALEAMGCRYALCAPTGRAAKRLSEATDKLASTIHRLLGFSPMEGFKYNSENPLPVEFLVVDEVSMLDLVLANNLLKALKPGTHLLLVGDVDQLPSVGAGDVLRDLIASETVAVCLDAMKDATMQFDGTVIKTIGDEVMATFDTVDEAMGAAIMMQKRITEETKKDGRVPVSIRIGCHYGPVVRCIAGVAGASCPGTQAPKAATTLFELLWSFAPGAKL